MCELVERNVGVVYAIAADHFRRYGGEYDDLVGDGMVGLVQAAQRFDPARFVGPFATYAHRRVTGAVMDGYRTRYYHGHHGRGGWRGDPSLSGEIEPLLPSAASAEDVALSRVLLNSVVERINGLPDVLRAPVRAVVDGTMLKELAARDGVTVTRISQRLAKARRRLAA